MSLTSNDLDKAKKPYAKLKGVAAGVALATFLIGCGQADKATSTTQAQAPKHLEGISLSDQINYPDQTAVYKAVNFYYGLNATIIEAKNSYSGTIEILVNDNNQLRRAYLMPDRVTIVEGAMRSPYAIREQQYDAAIEQESSIAEANAYAEKNKRLNELKDSLRVAIMSDDVQAAKQLMQSSAAQELNPDDTMAYHAIIETKENALAPVLTQEELLAQSMPSMERAERAMRGEGNDSPDAHSPVEPEPLATAPAQNLQMNTEPKLETATPPRNMQQLPSIKNVYDTLNENPVLWVPNGQSDKVLYVFFDLNCPACQQAEPTLQELAKDNKVQVRYVPVGILGDDSVYKAVSVLAHDTPAERLRIKEIASKRGRSQDIGLPQLSKEQLEKGIGLVTEAQTLFYATKRVATPAFMFTNNGGVQYEFISSPSQLRTMVNGIKP